MPNQPPEIDQRQLYGNYQRTERWRENLNRKLLHKSLDIPEDEMDVRVSNQGGLGWRELTALAAIAGAAAFYFKPAPPVTPPAADPPPVVEPGTDADTILEWDE